ncbi:MAG: outer membrane protein [Xanthobacteraceae bacterium]
MPVRNCLPSVAAIAWLVATPAFAADMPALPWLSSPSAESSVPPDAFADPDASLAMHSGGTSWRGFYIGGQFSYSDGSADFSKSTQAPISYSLRETTLENELSPSNWPVLGTADHSAAGFGGFVGYNVEYFTSYAKIVLGVEANYDQASLSFIAPNSPISRITPADSSGDTYLVNITGSGTVSDLDFGTLRARAGWDFGNFLPYAFTGLALGRANVNIAETTSGEQNPPAVGVCSGASTPPCMPFSFSGTAGKNGEWLYGFTVGAGLDVALTQNVFLRGEYEYVQFQQVAGTNIDINTVRAGAGFRF